MVGAENGAARARERHNGAVTGLALFDLDNTLVDRQAAFDRWAHGFVLHHALPPAALDELDTLDENGFASREQVFEGIAERFGISDSVEDLIAAYRVDYPEYFHPDPEVNQALGRLRSRAWSIGVVTNGPLTQRVKLERAGLLGEMDGICISDEVGVAKPDPGIFAEAQRRCLGPAPRDGPRWMVGDTPGPDIVGGIRAGFRTIWLHHGRTWDLDEYRPDAQVASIAEAVEHMLGTGPGD